MARRRAVERLYLEYGGRIRNYYRLHGASPADAENWLHETFVRVLRSIDTLRDHSRLAAWLWRTARNVMIDAMRSANRLPSVDGEMSETLCDKRDGPVEQLEHTQIDECVRRGFDRFAARYPECAQCLVWATVDGLTMQELAELIGRSEGATREYLSQCRKKLRPYLESCFASLTESPDDSDRPR